MPADHAPEKNKGEHHGQDGQPGKITEAFAATSDGKQDHGPTDHGQQRQRHGNSGHPQPQRGALECRVDIARGGFGR